MSNTRLQRDQINTLPNEPGVYRYFNEDEELIYVGKAKNLKKRVTTYFLKNLDSRKTKKMVSEIRGIEFTIVNSELDALLLENNLIKSNQPKYNILLRDDKTYPHIIITKEPFPRVYPIRTINKEWGKYYGPYASVKGMKNILELIHGLYPIRTCKYFLSESNIRSGKFKVCLEYHIGNCLGPCVGLQEEASYLEDIKQVENILKGKLSVARAYFKEQMILASEKLDFERAQKLKSKFDLVDQFQAKSLVVSQVFQDIDALTIVTDEKRAYVNYMKVQNGTITATQSVEVKKKLDESAQDILALMMVEFRERYNSTSKEIITNIDLTLDGTELKIHQPKIGDKKKLIDLSLKNALYFKKDRLNQVKTPQEQANRVLETLKNDLRLQELPKHIECFDNSNMQGTNPVASMVCFINGKPAKREYRKFKIKTIVGSDDFGSMNEIVKRRYTRLKEENKPYPNLIIIDGGKGQLSAACEALKEVGVYGKIPIVGIAKRLEEIYYPNDPYPLHIDKKSEGLILIQKLRDEAHRFAITFHRDLRSKNAFNSALADIPGIGPKTVEKLLQHFKTVKAIKEAPEEKIAVYFGKKKAAVIKQYLNNDHSKE